MPNSGDALVYGVIDVGIDVGIAVQESKKETLWVFLCSEVSFLAGY